MLTELQFPWTQRYGLVTSGLPSKGPTCEAIKRAMSRLGHLPWNDFDQHYNAPLAAALEEWDPGHTGYGTGRWTKLRSARVPASEPHAGEYAMDDYALTLVQNEAGHTAASTDEARVQTAIAKFGYTIIANAARIGYLQFRPVPVTVNPSGIYSSDCSATVIQAFHFARATTGLNVPDPAKQNWSGYGNTDYFEDDWPKVGAPFRIGDLAHFHSSRHVIFAIKAGDIHTAEWCSHGRPEAPELVRLSNYSRFPSEYLYTVRPTLIA